MKPNCYECKYLGTVPGDAHICCKYPGTITSILGYYASQNNGIFKKLNIRGNPHGIKSRWFEWPVSYDPTWLENCDGFFKKDELVINGT